VCNSECPLDRSADSIVGHPPRNRRRWQIGLRTVFLLTAAIAVWIAFFVNRRQNAVLEQRLAALRSIAHGLDVYDNERIAVVALDKLWFDDEGWDIFLPHVGYRLCLATRGIDVTGFASAFQSRLIRPGRHRIVLEQKKTPTGWHISIVYDGYDLLAVDERSEWYNSTASFGGSEFSLSEQLHPDKPVVLFRCRFATAGASDSISAPVGPRDGILLWIEPAAKPIVTR
jgi:hypothetical protein